jgi:hypothetical protein
MRFVCDAGGGTSWFRIETEVEAAREAELRRHAVEKHFRRAYEQAYRPTPEPFVEQDIGRAVHIRRTMPVFLTLRDAEGTALVTAMLPPERRQAPGRADPACSPMVVGPGNSDPYPAHRAAIEELGRRFGIALDRARCYPYGRL